MKILINASTLVVGGGIQVALNFIKHTLSTNKHEFYYLLSPQVYDQISTEIEEKSFSVIAVSPAKFLSSKESKIQILKIEQDFNPNIVYSIGAPSYMSFKTKEVLRLTNPWIIGATKVAYSTYPIMARLSIQLKVLTQRFFVKKDHIIITQTETAKKDIHKSLNIALNNIFVVPNVQSSIFMPKVKSSDKEIKSVFAFAAPHFHKNISIIPLVAKNLIELGVNNFVFKVTLPEEVINSETMLFHRRVKKFNLESYIHNLGKIKFSEAPDIYQESDVLFLPTLLEIFSVTYLEAMASEVPIVTTDLSFSREVCGEGALYFPPKDAVKAAKCLKIILEDEEKKNQILSFAKEKLLTFDKEEFIYNEHLKVLEQL